MSDLSLSSAESPPSAMASAADPTGQTLRAGDVADRQTESGMIRHGEDISTETPTLIIRPTSGWAALNLREVWQFRDLLFTLAGRDLKLRYKQTALGIIWVILQPLMAAGIFAFVFGKVAKLPSGGVPYMLFAFAGLLGWNLFSNTLTKASACLVGNAQLISKVFFPRLVLPLSTVPSTLVDFGVAAGMMAVLMAVYRVAPSWTLLLVPLWLTTLLMIALGLGLCASALAVSYRDIQYVLPVFVQILLYASPVAYAVSAVPEHLRMFYAINPLTGPLEALRASMLGGAMPAWGYLVWSAAAGVGLMILGAASFKRMERKFADVI